MRRLLIVVSVTVFADTMLFSAIVPLIPGLAATYDLSKLEAGMLLAAYGAGAVISGIPSGILAVRLGPKRTVITGLILFAAATLAFALGSSAWSLEAARFAQGAASAITWCGALAWLTLATPRAQRGKALGIVFSFAVLGFVIGPAVGAAAHLSSIRTTFTVLAVAIVGVTVFASSFPAGRQEARQPRALRRMLHDTTLLVAVWLTVVPSLFFGVADLLVPLALDEAAWGAIAIAATFIVAALAEVALAPAIGAFSDRRGRLLPIRLGLLLVTAAALILALATSPYLIAVLVTGASVAVSVIYTPSTALISDRAERSQVPQGLAFGVMNSMWASGVMVGPLLGGAIAQALGDPAPYILSAAIALGTFLFISRDGFRARVMLETLPD
ncbi:MAG: MFS transporter [Thermoleophilia bacterium]